MTVQWGDTGRCTIGTLKMLNISPYISEQSLTATALPVGAGASNVPASPVATWTVNTSTMAPTFSGVNVLSYKGVYGFNVSGQNSNGAAQTVYYQINKNGASYKTGNISVTNLYYWTVSLEDGTLANGDKIDFYIWTPASSGVTYSYQNNFCFPSKVDTGAKRICNVAFNLVNLHDTSQNYFPVAGSSLGSAWAGSIFVNTVDDTSQSGQTIAPNKTVNMSFLGVNATNKLYIAAADGFANVGIQMSSNQLPRMYSSVIVKSISYRDLFY